MTGSDGAKLKKRSVRIAGHLTSISLEQVFWDGLKQIADDRNLSINALVTEIDLGRDGNLSSAIRVYVYENAKR